MALPDAVQYGLVTWRAVSAVADSSDPDAQPDAVPVSGKITFTPSAPVLLTRRGIPVTVIAVPVTYDLDADGVLRDSQGRDGVMLVATDSVDLTPVGWTWTVSYRLNGGLSRGSFSFALPAGGVVDLTDVATVPASGGVQITRGPEGPPGPPGGRPPLIADPSHPGLYLLVPGSGELVPDPAHPGLYLIGATK